MATIEITLAKGWNAASGPGSLTMTVEDGFWLGKSYGWAVAPVPPTGLTKGGHEFRYRTESMSVDTGENAYVYSDRAGVVLTVTRESAPI